jgi:hypothetical protein
MDPFHNISALRNAMLDLQAEVIAVPPFDVRYLRKGHALHFRCRHPEAEGLRVDVMSRMRGVDSFEKLWSRRSTVELPDGTTFDLLSLPDLVQAKKTQRDKDWPMIRRLVEADFFARRDTANAVVSGEMQRRALALVLEWWHLHRTELLDDWHLAQAGKSLRKIEPLD